MKTTITYNGKQFTEENNSAPKLIRTRCKCDNELVIPLGALVLGLVKDCAHCGKDYPLVAHCRTITESYKGLIEGETSVDLD